MHSSIRYKLSLCDICAKTLLFFSELTEHKEINHLQVFQSWFFSYTRETLGKSEHCCDSMATAGSKDSLRMYIQAAIYNNNN